MMIQHPEVAEKIEQELICTFEKSEKEDQSAAPTIMNSKKSGIDDDDDSKASDEASFNLRVAEYSQHLTYDSLLNLQYLYAAILETLRLYPAVPMVRTHTQKLNPSQMIFPPVLPCNLSLQKTSMCFFINV
jgi:cytochrome P450